MTYWVIAGALSLALVVAISIGVLRWRRRPVPTWAWTFAPDEDESVIDLSNVSAHDVYRVRVEGHGCEVLVRSVGLHGGSSMLPSDFMLPVVRPGGQLKVVIDCAPGTRHLAAVDVSWWNWQDEQVRSHASRHAKRERLELAQGAS